MTQRRGYSEWVGVRLINEYVVKLALKERLTFSSLAAGDTTAQEAAIPYPTR